MKNLNNYKNFTNLLYEDAIGLKIKNEYTKLINDPKQKNIIIGEVGAISNTDISNLKQTYKDAIIKVVDGNYVLSLNESVIDNNLITKYTSTQSFINIKNKLLDISTELEKDFEKFCDDTGYDVGDTDVYNTFELIKSRILSDSNDLF